MLVIGGNDSPSAADIEGLLGSVGVEADAAQLERLVAELSGKSVEELKTMIDEGREKLASVAVGGGAGGAVASGGSDAAPAVEEEEEEEEEEVDMGGGMDMFGGGDDY